MTRRRADEFVVKGTTSDMQNLAPVFIRLEGQTIDRIQRVARQVGKPTILIDPEVVKPSLPTISTSPPGLKEMGSTFTRMKSCFAEAV